jgi:regulator of replication initiation timing
MSENSKNVLIVAIREKIKKLEKENEQLRQEAERLRGRLYEQF